MDNTLALVNPVLAAQWHPTKNDLLTPSSITPKSSKKVWWQCSQGHEWESSVSNRAQGRGCPYCGGRLVLAGYNDLATLRPDLALQWHSTKNHTFLPTQISVGSKKKVWWQCDLGHEWQAVIYSRKTAGCPVCSNQQVLSGHNDLATTHPEFTSQWNYAKNSPITPYSVRQGSDKSYWWVCALGHEWQTTPAKRVLGRGCPVCSGRKLVKGFNDLSTLHPELASEWHKTKNSQGPEETLSIMTTVVWWECALGHEWQARIDNRRRGSGCLVCAGHQVAIGFNDLTTTHPDLAAQWHPTLNEIQASEVTSGRQVRYWWRCEKGHEWQAHVCDRTRIDKGTNCPICSQSGTSNLETEVFDWISSLGLKVLRNDRTILKNLELDILLPAHNFAIEFNGLYWHSEATGKDKYYHKKKAEASLAAGITLFQIWEDDWILRQEITKRMILHRLGLSQESICYARKAQVVQLTKTEAYAFLDENHIQGSASGGLYLGLVSERELIAVMVLKMMGKGTVYLERYATSCRVPGGFTKLLKQAVLKLQPREIVTFADLNISDGGLYVKTGFIAQKVLSPDYMYLVRGQRVHKFNYRLKRFRNDPSLQFVEGMSETQLAALNKLYRIWDSGKIRYVLSL